VTVDVRYRVRRDFHAAPTGAITYSKTIVSGDLDFPYTLETAAFALEIS
jgi:hypothetical protein